MHLWEYIFPAIAAAVTLAAVIYLIRRASVRGQTADHPMVRQCLFAFLAALFLFLLIQSGIERRLGPDLFLPVRAGIPAPGRTLCLCASILVCFALSMTGFGRNGINALSRICSRDRGRYAVSAAVTVLFFLWTVRVTNIRFLTNDDTTLMRTIANIPENGLSSAVSSYSSFLLCGMLGLLYRLSADVPWYALFEILVLFVSCMILGRCILLKSEKRGLPAPAGILLHLAACGCIFLYPLGNLSFTVTPAIGGSAAAALIFCRGDLETRRARVISDIAAVILMILCCLQRGSTGKCLLCFFALAAAYQIIRILFSGSPDRKKHILSVTAVLCITFALCFSLTNIPEPEAETRDIMDEEIRSTRITVTDYLMGSLTDEQFEAAGIPSELAVLLRDWYFLDDRLDADSLKKLVDMYYTPVGISDSTSSSPSMIRSVLSAVSASLHHVISDQSSLLLCLSLVAPLLFLALLCLLNVLRYGKHSLPELLCTLGSLGGFMIFALFILTSGRMPFRSFLVFVIPALFLMGLAALTTPENAGRNHRRWTEVMSCALLVLLILSNITTVLATPRITEYTDRSTLFSTQQKVEEYADSHPDNLIINNLLAENLDPFHSGTYPDNMLHWSGNNFNLTGERMDASVFFREDVLFMYLPLSTVLGLVNYLSLDYGPVQAVNLAALTDMVYVADISRVTPGENYTGWYECNGMTYYFEEGTAVTGKHMIDGTEYEFAPAGNEADFIILPGENLIYTTNAYSLVSAS